MNKRSSLYLGVGTVATALAIGAFMQYGLGFRTGSGSQSAALSVSDVQDVSSAPMPKLPSDRVTETALPAAVVSNSAQPEAEPERALPEGNAAAGFSCNVDMAVTPVAGAMMQVELSAPCNGSERVTLHHNGLMFTEVMQPDGTLSVTVPALAEYALVVASFLDGSGAVGQTQVSSLPFYDRIVLQWRGDAGLQLHAREFDAPYFSEGHVWSGANTDVSRAIEGKGGFMTRLGNPDGPDALLAEVYTFPTGTSSRDGTITLTVETEIQQQNCGASVEAQTLEMRDGGELSARDITIEVPGCDAAGDFLMLKNVVGDLTIARN